MAWPADRIGRRASTIRLMWQRGIRNPGRPTRMYPHRAFRGFPVVDNVWPDPSDLTPFAVTAPVDGACRAAAALLSPVFMLSCGKGDRAATPCPHRARLHRSGSIDTRRPPASWTTVGNGESRSISFLHASGSNASWPRTPVGFAVGCANSGMPEISGILGASRFAETGDSRRVRNEAKHRPARRAAHPC